MDNNITLRMASPDDAAALLAIYAPYVVKTAITYEYAVPSEAEFRGRIEHTLEKYPYIVAEENGVILGYAYISRFRERAAYDWSVETSIYVDENEHGRGVGTVLYKKIEEISAIMGILNLNASICYPNDDSIAFHEALGYKTVGIFSCSGWKLGRWWDMLWMEKMIGSHDGSPTPVRYINEIDVAF